MKGSDTIGSVSSFDHFHIVGGLEGLDIDPDIDTRDISIRGASEAGSRHSKAQTESVIIRPTKDANLNSAVGAELDDEFFSSDPGTYYRARVVSLLTPAGSTGIPSALKRAVESLLESECVSHLHDLD